MPDCELRDACPFYIKYTEGYYTRAISELIESVVEEYCRGDYLWCGRYMAYKALEEEIEREFLTLPPIPCRRLVSSS